MGKNHDDPLSKTEAILQNMLGEENELTEPVSRTEALLMEIMEQGGGGGAESFVVEFSPSGSTVTTQTSIANIIAAANAGKIVQVKLTDEEVGKVRYGTLTDVGTDTVGFVFLVSYGADSTILAYVKGEALSNTDSWEMMPFLLTPMSE